MSEEDILSSDNVPNNVVRADPTMCLVVMFLANKPIKNHVMKERRVVLTSVLMALVMETKSSTFELN